MNCNVHSENYAVAVIVVVRYVRNGSTRLWKITKLKSGGIKYELLMGLKKSSRQIFFRVSMGNDEYSRQFSTSISAVNEKKNWKRSQVMRIEITTVLQTLRS